MTKAHTPAAGRCDERGSKSVLFFVDSLRPNPKAADEPEKGSALTYY